MTLRVPNGFRSGSGSVGICIKLSCLPRIRFQVNKMHVNFEGFFYICKIKDKRKNYFKKFPKMLLRTKFTEKIWIRN
jgi:hypothetical protein